MLFRSGGDISEMTVKTLDAITTEFPVPVAGEKPKTFLGKVKKFFEDTKNWMTGVCLIGQIVNNCVTNNAKLPLSAAQGKVLMDLYTVLNTKITDTSRTANTANAKIELNGPLKIIAYGSDKNKWALQQQFPDGVILSLGISETEIFYDYYDGAKWVRKWTR